MTERARKLRERVRDVLDQMCPAADPPFGPEEAVHVLRAVVEEFGVSKAVANLQVDIADPFRISGNVIYHGPSVEAVVGALAALIEAASGENDG